MNCDAKINHLKGCFDETVEVRKKLDDLKHSLSFKREVLIGWEPHTHPLVKINTDGAAKENLVLAGSACELRDAQGKWVVGAVRNLGVTSSVSR